MKRVYKALLSVFAFIFIIGVAFTNNVSAKSTVEVELTDSETVKEDIKVQFDELATSSDEEKTDKVVNQALRKLKSGVEFTFHGEKWIVLNGEDGFVMMKKSVNELNMKDVNLNVPSEIIEYLETTYKEELSKDEQQLFKSSFGLTKYNDELHATIHFDPELKLNKDGELVSSDSQSTKEVKQDHRNLYTVIVSGLLIVILVSTLVFVIKNKKHKKVNR